MYNIIVTIVQKTPKVPKTNPKVPDFRATGHFWSER
jgi:hypothetical protein